MYSIPTAADVRRQLNEKLKKDEAVWGEKINKAIQEAVANYSLTTYIEGEIPESLKNHLIELGYEVVFFNDEEGTRCTKISAQETV